MRYVFDRVENGWIVSIMDGEYRTRFTFEDPDDGDATPGLRPEATSLANAIWSAFQAYTQSKHVGGIMVDSRPPRSAE